MNKCMSLEIDLVSLFTVFLFTKYHFSYQAGPRSVTKVPLVLFLQGKNKGSIMQFLCTYRGILTLIT